MLRPSSVLIALCERFSPRLNNFCAHSGAEIITSAGFIYYGKIRVPRISLDLLHERSEDLRNSNSVPLV